MADISIDSDSLFRSIIKVTNIRNNQRVRFLKLHMKYSAPQFFQTLDAATRGELELTTTAPKNKFCYPNLKKIHQINLESVKFNHKSDSPEKFQAKLLHLAMKVFPPTVGQPKALVDCTVPDDQDLFDRGTRENENRLSIAKMEMKRHIMRLFKKARSICIRLKLLEEPKTAHIQKLCSKARQKLKSVELCPVDDWSRDGFNEMSSDSSDKLKIFSQN